MGADDDDTVRLNVARASARAASHRVLPWFLATAVIAAGAAGGTWWLLQPPAPGPVQTAAIAAPVTPPPQPARAAPSPAAPVVPVTASVAPPIVAPPTVPPAAPTQAGFAPPAATPTPLPPTVGVADATMAGILADNPSALAIYRFGPQPGVLVLQFATLHEQAMMLNRVAAFVEKSGFPHDKVISHAELDRKIQAEGGSPDTFYYGHDYCATDLERFFELATDLDPEESRLKDLVHQAGWATGQPDGALISLVRLSSADGLDEPGRAAILQHELSHAVYFTNPAYASFCQHFWQDVLTDSERAKFTTFLAGEGYDTSISDLMINETQAYLMHTPDRRFFDGAQVGITPERLNELRQTFLVGMPAGWLRDHTKVASLP